MSNKNTGLQLHTMQEMGQFARAAQESGFFPDVRAAAAGIIKVQWGMELGIGPVTALTGIHNIKGKLAMSATLIASLIQRAPGCRYEVVEMSDEAVELRCFRDDKPIGPSRFTLEDAKKADLLRNPTWQKYPRNMMFARAIANAARWYFADVFHGAPVYTEDERGGEPVEVEVDNVKLQEALVAASASAPETEVIDAEVVEESAPEPAEDPGPAPDLEVELHPDEVPLLRDYINAVRKCDTEEQLKDTIVLGKKLATCSVDVRLIARAEFNLAMATAKGDDARLLKLDQDPGMRAAWAMADKVVGA